MSARTTLTLNASDIAQLAAVGRSTVSNWRQRFDDFPNPVAGGAATPRFAETEVRAWLAAHGKEVRELNAGRILWSAMDSSRGTVLPEDAGAIVGDLIAWRYVSDPTSKAFDESLPPHVWWPELQASILGPEGPRLIETGMKFYENAHLEHSPMFSLLHGRLGHLIHEMNHRHQFLASALASISGFDPDRLEEVFVSFQDHLTRSARRGYDEFATSNTLVELTAALARTVPGPVHDPVVGSGRMLMAAGSQGDNRTFLTGQDINLNACIQANQRALLAGCRQVQIRPGDVFREDHFDQGLAQVVVMDPPYGLRWHGGENLDLDPRLPYGTPPKSTMDTAWLQLALWYLGAQGRAFVLQPAGSAFRGGAEAKIRAAMLQAGTLEAVIALPGGLASHTRIPLNLWVLARPGEVKDPTRVLLIDQSEATDIDSDVVAQALEAWREHRTVPASLPAAAYTVADLLAENADLNPRRWISSSADAPDLQAVRSAVEALERSVANAHLPVKLSAASLRGGAQTPKMVSITDLEKAGRLNVLRASAKIREADYGTEGMPVVTGSWIRGQDDSRKVTPDVFGRESVITETGDILLQNSGGLAARVDTEGGRVLASSSFYLLRLNGDAFLPEFLAEFLVSSQNRSHAQGAAIQRVRLQDMKVPMLTRDQQGDVIERLAEARSLQMAAYAILAAAATARKELVDAVTAGTVSIS